MKIVYIVPHLPTGGMPEYLRRKIELLHKDHQIWVFEIYFESKYPAIRHKIKLMIGDRLISMQRNYKKLFEKLIEITPDIVHFEEVPETFLPDSLLEKIYDWPRAWKIFETLHDSSIDYREKRFVSDKMLVVSQWQVKNFLPLGIPIEIIEHEIISGERNRGVGMKKLGLDPTKKHVLQVGLFSNRKNQRFTFSLAREMPDVQFHFVGSLPYAYEDHWKDLVENKPDNCTIWGERDDVPTFYSCVDVVIFPSEGKYGDTETNPLAIKEAISWKIPLFLRNIPVYMNMYGESNLLKYITNSLEENKKILYNMLDLVDNYTLIKKEFFDQKLFNITFDREDNKLTLSYLHDEPLDLKVCIRDLDTEVPIFSFLATFENKNDYWAIPLPKHYYDFFENPNFSGFLVDFYDPGDNLLYQQSHQIKLIDKPKPKCRIDTYEPIFINYEQFFTDRIYDSFLDGIKKLDTVLDIGSSVGLFTKLVKDRGAGRVIAFEVSEKASKTFRKLHLDDSSITLVESAIWDREDLIKIYQDPDNSIVSSAITFSDHYFQVPSVSLDSYFLDNNIEKVSLMKMDIEGSEYRAFDGLSDNNLQKIENIILEFHDNTNKVLSNQILKRLDKLGFNYLIFQEDCETISDGISDEKGVVFISRNKTNFFSSGYSDIEVSLSKKEKITMLSDVVIIDSFVYSPTIEAKLISQIEKFKSRGFDIILVSNTLISKEIQSIVNFFFYDSRNQLFTQKYNQVNDIVYKNYIYSGDEWQFTLNTQVPNLQKHGLSVLVNLNNVVSLAKSLGYTRFLRVEVDDIYSEKSLDKIDSLILEMDRNGKKSTLFFNDRQDQDNDIDDISFHLMIWDIDFYRQIIPNIQNENDYKLLLEQKWKNNDFRPVEILFRDLVENNREHINIQDGKNMSEIFEDTTWNTEAPLSSLSSNYGDFYSDIFKIQDSDDIFLFSQNLSSKEIALKFEIQYLDNTLETIDQIVPSYPGGWCWNRLSRKITKVDIFHQNKKISTKHINELKNWAIFPQNDDVK